MFKKLIRREQARRDRGSRGLLLGTDAELLELRERARSRTHELRVSIAQPGLSAERATDNQLRLLGCAELYVREIASGPFDVWCSRE